MDRIRITDENVDELVEKYGEEWWTMREILASFAKLQRQYFTDWGKDGTVRFMETGAVARNKPRYLYNVGDVIVARHRMRECKPFLNKIGTDGIRLFRCNECEEWKPHDQFHANTSGGRGSGMHTKCKVCHKAATDRWRENNPIEIIKTRERSRRRRRENTARARAVSEWERSQFVDPQIIVDFLDKHYPGVSSRLLSERCGEHDDFIRKVRKQAENGKRIMFATADTILGNLGGENLLAEIVAEMEKERPRWHPKWDYCQLCMRTSVAHEAKGYCYTCYNRRDDPTYVPIMEGQWARRHTCCLDCGTTKRRHYGLGLCTRCWQRRHRRSRKVGSGHGNDGLVQAGSQATDDGGGRGHDLGRVACQP
jgi:hypothetical protein